jgi:hypothetical protein
MESSLVSSPQILQIMAALVNAGILHTRVLMDMFAGRNFLKNSSIRLDEKLNIRDNRYITQDVSISCLLAVFI